MNRAPGRLVIRVLIGALLFAAAFGFPRSLQAKEFSVASYNLENYLLMNRRGAGENAPKPEDEIAALIAIIENASPDILGVCELGDRTMYENLEGRLADAGLGYSDSEYLENSPDDRHLALFSRFPIVSRQSVGEAPYDLGGTRQMMRRGMLDITVRIGDGFDLRLLGVHLKSKRPVPEGEALVRRHEAQLLRERIVSILEAAPESNLLVYGDLNDTKNEPPVREVEGRRNSRLHMDDIPIQDDRGERWTYYWQTADIYSRIDYIFASPALGPDVVKEKCFIARPRNWEKASDHCLISATFDTEREK